MDVDQLSMSTSAWSLTFCVIRFKNSKSKCHRALMKILLLTRLMPIATLTKAQRAVTQKMTSLTYQLKK